MGWQGRDIAISGRNEGNAGIIFNTGIENDGLLTARVDGRMVKLSGIRITCLCRLTVSTTLS